MGDERRRLESHLEGCPGCSNALKDYRRIAESGMPSLAPDFISELRPTASVRSTGSIKRKLFERLSLERDSRTDREDGLHLAWPRDRRRKHPTSTPRSTELPLKTEILLGCAASLLLVLGLTTAAYRLGERKTAGHSQTLESAPSVNNNSLQKEVAAFTEERRELDARLRGRERAIASLTVRMNQQLLQLAASKNKGRVFKRWFVQPENRTLRLPGTAIVQVNNLLWLKRDLGKRKRS